MSSKMEKYYTAVAHVTKLTGRPQPQWTYNDKDLFQLKMIELNKQQQVSRPSTPSTYGLLQQQIGKTKAKEILETSKTIELPSIIIQPNLSSDPCIDDMNQKTDDTSGMVKIILIGVVIGVILGVIK